VAASDPAPAHRFPRAGGPGGHPLWNFFGRNWDTENSRPHFDREMTDVISGPVPGQGQGVDGKKPRTPTTAQAAAGEQHQHISKHLIAVGCAERCNESNVPRMPKNLRLSSHHPAPIFSLSVLHSTLCRAQKSIIQIVVHKKIPACKDASVPPGNLYQIGHGAPAIHFKTEILPVSCANFSIESPFPFTQFHPI
jgi:hypothetical protein